MALAATTASAPLRAGELRVLCLGDSVDPWCHDFANLAQAQGYADDVASEAEHGPIVTVISDGVAVVGRGRAW